MKCKFMQGGAFELETELENELASQLEGEVKVRVPLS